MRKLKIIIGLLLLIFILSSAGVVSYFYFNQDKIIKAFVEEINYYLDVEAKVESISLNIFDHWPLVAVELKKSSIRGANCGIPEPLLQAENLSILANPISILTADYNIRRIYIEKGRIYIFRDQHCSNYNIFKTSSGTATDIMLENIKLSKVELVYESRTEHQKFQFYSEKATISGAIEEKQIYADHKGQWKITSLKSDTYDFDHDQLFNIQHSFKLDRVSDFIFISDLKTNFLSPEINAEAILDLKEDQSVIKIRADNFQVDKLKKFLNGESNKFIEDYNVKSKFSFEALLNGDVFKNQWKCNVDMHTKNLSLTTKNPDQNIKITELKASWSLPSLSDWKNSNLSISLIKGNNEGSEFSGSFKINQFENTKVKAQLFTSQKASLISEILDLPINKDVSGIIDIDLAYNGLLPNKKSGFPKNAELSGILTLNEVKFQTLAPSVLIENMNGQLVYDKGIITVQNLSGTTANSDFLLNGLVYNSMDYFLTKNSKMFIETKINSAYINLEEWINDSDYQNQYVLKLPERIIHKHQLSIRKLNFKRFKANNINGELSIKNQIMTIDSVRMDVAGGNILVNMDLDAGNPQRIEWFTSGYLNKVFIDSVFYIFKDFKQDFIQQRHLEGQLTATYTGFMVSDDHLNFDLDKHIFSINSKISNGRLIFFEPLQAISKFIREDDLMNLKFDDLENEIFIKDRMIALPKMAISSNVRTINVQGTHSFDNNIDYSFEIPVSSEKKDKDSRFGKIKDEKTGKTKLLLRLTGTTSDYQVKYNDEAVKENIKQGIKEEVIELKKVLKNQKEKEEAVELEEDEYFDFN